MWADVGVFRERLGSRSRHSRSQAKFVRSFQADRESHNAWSRWIMNDSWVHFTRTCSCPHKHAVSSPWSKVKGTCGAYNFLLLLLVFPHIKFKHKQCLMTTTNTSALRLQDVWIWTCYFVSSLPIKQNHMNFINPPTQKRISKNRKKKKNVVLKMPVTVDQSLLQVTADWLAQQENKTNLCKEFSRNWCCLCSDISKILLWGSQYIFSFFVLSKFKTQSESPLLVLHSQGASFSHKTLLLVK